MKFDFKLCQTVYNTNCLKFKRWIYHLAFGNLVDLSYSLSNSQSIQRRVSEVRRASPVTRRDFSQWMRYNQASCWNQICCSPPVIHHRQPTTCKAFKSIKIGRFFLNFKIWRTFGRTRKLSLFRKKEIRFSVVKLEHPNLDGFEILESFQWKL